MVPFFPENFQKLKFKDDEQKSTFAELSFRATNDERLIFSLINLSENRMKPFFQFLLFSKDIFFSCFQNEDTNYLMVDAYSARGFTLNNGMKVFGPMILFPNSVLSWRVQVPTFLPRIETSKILLSQ